MFYNILDQKRLDILPLFREFKYTFYLAGGTALALQIGHRDSFDFDFFCGVDIRTEKLFEQLRKVFQGHKLLKIQEETNTLTVLIDESIKVIFFTYNYKLIDHTTNDENLTYASIADIGCMKLSAVTGRASNKDYFDLYFILNLIPLADLLDMAQKKYPELDRNLILKSLVYFEDITREKIIFKNNKDMSFEEVEKKLKLEVAKLAIL